MTFEDVLLKGKLILKSAGIQDADIDAWYLFEFCFKISRSRYFVVRYEEADNIITEKFLKLVHMREKHIPLQHITGVQDFMGLEFIVSPDVLVPRQDTELLVEEVLKVSEGKDVLDMCTGSGCIIISLSKLGKINSGTAADISSKALDIAKKNNKKHEADILFIESNLFENIDRRYDIIVSNPPYIKTKDIEMLMPEVRDHEPLMALDGSEDGLYFYKSIIKESLTYLNKEGFIFLEIGYNQGYEVKRIMEDWGFINVTVKKDLAGLDRVVYGNKS